MIFLKFTALLVALSIGTAWAYPDYDDYVESRGPRNYFDSNRGSNQRLQQGRCDSRSCVCSQEYIPFCGTDGITYGNKCQLRCAQNCDRGLEVKFEGVCPEPYIHRDGSSGRQPANGVGVPPPVQVGTRPITVVDKNRNGNYVYGANTPRPSFQLPIYTFPTTRRYGDEFVGRNPTTTPRPFRPTPGYQTPIYTFPTTRRYGDDYGRYPINTTPNPYPTRGPPPTASTRPIGRYQQWLATSTTERSWFVPPPRGPYSPPSENRLDWR